MLLLLLPTHQKTKQALSQHQAGESGTRRPRDKKVALLVAVSNDISLLHHFIARDVQARCFWNTEQALPQTPGCKAKVLGDGNQCRAPGRAWRGQCGKGEFWEEI